MAKIKKVTKKSALKTKPKKVPVKIQKVEKEKFVPHQTGLKPGDQAPHFEGQDQNGKLFSLDNYKGKKLILFFYPQDNTPTCTNEVCNLQENFKNLKKAGYEVVGVSPDDVKSHLKFATKFKLDFKLLADVEKKAIKAYDVWGIKQFMGKIYDGILRTTFIINEQGTIEHVITKVVSKSHAEQISNL